MRILHVTDLHFNQQHFAWIKTKQHEYDALCLTGDFLDDSNRQQISIDSQIAWISDWMLSLNTPVFICSGNHDVVVPEPEESLESLFLLDDEYSEQCNMNEDTTLLGSLAWLNDLSKKNKVFTDRQITSLNGVIFGCIPYGCDAFEKYRTCDVILYHVPPSGLDVARDNIGDHGCAVICRELESKALQPTWILSGHIHHPKKAIVRLGETSISNPGRGRSAIPKYNVIDIPSSITQGN